MNAAVHLEERLGFVRFGLDVLAAAMVTEDEAKVGLVEAFISSLPIDESVSDDLLAGALDTVASLAAAEASRLRGEEPHR